MTPDMTPPKPQSTPPFFALPEVLCRIFISGISALVLVFSVGAQDLSSNETAGPDAVENLLDGQSEAKPGFLKRDSLEGWKAWKGTLDDKTGLSFGGDYNSLVFGATDSLGEDDASSGVFRLYGKWNLLGRGTEDTGGMVFKVEHRHSYGNVAPTAFAPQVGYIGALHTTFNDDDFRTTNLYWRQSFADQQFVIYTGFLDSTDWLDIYPMASPWTGFNNIVFATGSGTIGGLPDGTLGAMGAVWLTDSLYAIGSITDANGRSSDISEGPDTFFNEFETLKTFELYWTPEKEKLMFNKLNAAVWQIDSATTKGTPKGWGVSASASATFDDAWLFFLRGGWADDGGSLYDRSVSVGFGHQPQPSPNLLGLGLNWGRPNQDTFPGNPGTQFTSELFYRWQATPNFTVTPSVQLLVDPALNPEDDAIAVFGLRGRFAF
jgi:porin